MVWLSALCCSAATAASAAAVPGDLDPAFGTGGTVVTDFGNEDLLNDVAIQPDGKIVAVGFTAGRVASARYNLDGSLDPGYGGDGTVVTSVGVPGSGRAVGIQADGRIVVVGSVEGGPNPPNLLIVRYLADGSLDPSLDGDGVAITDFGTGEIPGGMALSPDGRIYIGVNILFGEEDLAVARFNPDGTLDNSFGTGGGAAFELPDEERAESIALQPDGKVVAAGLTDNNAGFDLLLARINPDGTPDLSFDGDGLVVTDRGGLEAGGSVAVQSDGKIVVGGFAQDVTEMEAGDSALARYLPDGSLDPTFAGGGFSTFDLRLDEGVVDLAIQPDGKYVAAAGVGFGAVRLTSTGVLDPEFGAGGGTAAELGAEGRETAVAIQRDGGIVVAGTVDAPANEDNFALARFAGDPVICSGRTATIVAAEGARIAGTPGNDVIAGTETADRIKSGKGKDLVCAQGASDRVNTGGGQDTVIGGKGRDVIRGGGGKDLLKGGGSNDTLNGGPARDRLVGGKGKRDRCKAQPGNDRTRGC